MVERKRLPYVLSGVVVLIGVVYAQKWILSLDFDTRGRILRAQIVLILQSLLALGDFIVWKNVADVLDFKDQSSRTRLNYIWRYMLIVYFSLVHLSYLSNVYLVRTEPSVFALGTYFLLAVQIQLLTALLILYLLNAFLGLIRRKTISKFYRVVISIMYACCVVTIGFIHAQGPPVITRIDIPVLNLSHSLDGFTFTQISDIHLGPTVGKSKFERVVKLVNELNSDSVVVTGDLVDGTVERLQKSADVIQNIQAKHGIYYVTGNHEYYTMDADNWLKYFSKVGVHVLHNSHRKVPSDQNSRNQLCIVGTDDLESERIQYLDHGFHLDSAIKGCDKEQTVILLAHQPKAALAALQSAHKIDVILSGHTHGGQIFPLIIGAYLINPFYVGLYQYGDSHIYVSPGTVYWGMPVRIFTQHEITHITLRKR